MLSSGDDVEQQKGALQKLYFDGRHASCNKTHQWHLPVEVLSSGDDVEQQKGVLQKLHFDGRHASCNKTHQWHLPVEVLPSWDDVEQEKGALQKLHFDGRHASCNKTHQWHLPVEVLSSGDDVEQQKGALQKLHFDGRHASCNKTHQWHLPVEVLSSGDDIEQEKGALQKLHFVFLPTNKTRTPTTHPRQLPSTTSCPSLCPAHTIPAPHSSTGSGRGAHCGSSRVQEGCSGGSRTYQQWSTAGQACLSTRCRSIRRQISTGDVSGWLRINP